MTIVKVCGLMEVEHAKAAVAAGVDWIGFVFAPSKREITVEQAQLLAQHIPSHVKKIGVFVDAAPHFIKDVYEKVQLDYIQYHGDETNSFIAQIGLPAIKAFAIRSYEDVKEALDYDVDYFLFDAPGLDFRGGSGHTFDWSLLQNFQPKKFLLAGGLHPENVRMAIETVQPFGVDVSSGVEIDGRKDSVIIQRFIQKAKGVNIL